VEQNYSSEGTSSADPGSDLRQGLQESAQEFSRSVEDAASRLGSAAQQFPHRDDELRLSGRAPPVGA
jgi:hypothetical protein